MGVHTMDKLNAATVVIKYSDKVIGEMEAVPTPSNAPIEVGNNMSRFVWVDNKELHDQVHGLTLGAIFGSSL